MVKLNEAYIFPNGSVPVVSQCHLMANQDLGIDSILVLLDWIALEHFTVLLSNRNGRFCSFMVSTVFVSYLLALLVWSQAW